MKYFIVFSNFSCSRCSYVSFIVFISLYVEYKLSMSYMYDYESPQLVHRVQVCTQSTGIV